MLSSLRLSKHNQEKVISVIQNLEAGFVSPSITCINN